MLLDVLGVAPEALETPKEIAEAKSNSMVKITKPNELKGYRKGFKYE